MIGMTLPSTHGPPHSHVRRMMSVQAWRNAVRWSETRYVFLPRDIIQKAEMNTLPEIEACTMMMTMTATTSPRKKTMKTMICQIIPVRENTKSVTENMDTTKSLSCLVQLVDS